VPSGEGNLLARRPVGATFLLVARWAHEPRPGPPASGDAEPVSGGRTGGGHGDLDAANAEMHDRTDLEQPETDGAASRGGEVGVMQADTTQCTEQHVGQGGEPRAQLIGPHGGCRGAVGIEVELAFP
jgi:hypothetical protein